MLELLREIGRGGEKAEALRRFRLERETDWRRLEAHADVHRFFRHMIAFRRAHPSLCRSRFWRDDVRYRLRGPDLFTRLVNGLLVAPDTRRIFEYRHRALTGILTPGGSPRQGPVRNTTRSRWSRARFTPRTATRTKSVPASRSPRCR